MSGNNMLATNDLATSNKLTKQAGTCQYLTFYMAGEEYGVDILHVQEIRGWEESTEIPNSPKYVKGVLNLRGTVVPVIDLRSRFNLPLKKYDETTVVIVLKVTLDGRNKVMGIIVDAVSDVYTFPISEIKPAPDVGAAINASFIEGLVNVENGMLNILKITNALDLNVVADTGVLTHTAS